MNILWLPLTLTSAVALAASDALTKKALSSYNEYLVIWLRLAFALPFLLGLLFFLPHTPPAPGFRRIFAISLVLELIATWLYMKALKLSPLSLTLPFLALTPVFLLVIPFLLLGERITPAGGAGILLIAVGSYSLNAGEWRKGFLAPLRAIRHEKGSLCMIAVAFIYSFTSTLGKQAITASSPIYFAATYYCALVAALTPFALIKGKRELMHLSQSGILKTMILPGLLNAAMVITHMLAINLTNVAYMIAVKRMSLLFGIAFGSLLLRETGIRERLAGGTMMVAGAALIVLGA